MRNLAGFLARRWQATQRGVEVLDILLLFVVAAAVIPTAFNAIFDVNTSGWGAAGTLWDLLPLFGIIALIYGIMRWSKNRGATTV
jgi:hypothetical protein